MNPKRRRKKNLTPDAQPNGCDNTAPGKNGSEHEQRPIPSQHSDDTPKWQHYYEIERRKFYSIKTPEGWTEKDDFEYYNGIWGDRKKYGQDFLEILQEDLEEIHGVLDSAICYFARKRGLFDPVQRLAITLDEKVSLVSELLPDSKDRDYTLRFTIDLARITWLESERKRIQRHEQRWFFPHYHVADCFLDAAAELEESLQCEHNDFDLVTLDVPLKTSRYLLPRGPTY